MSNYVFYDSPERARRLRCVKYLRHSRKGYPTVDEVFRELVEQFPRLIVIEENYGERVVMQGPEADWNTTCLMYEDPVAAMYEPVREMAWPNQTIQSELVELASQPFSLDACQTGFAAGNRIFQTICETLVEMGDDSIRGGKPYGLRGYPDFHREQFPGSFSPARWEEPITAGLALRLNRKGIQADVERQFPNGGRCDLVIQAGVNESLWIEVKTAFRPCLSRTVGALYDYDYEGDSTCDPKGKGSWTAGVADIAMKDIRKLRGLSHPHAHHIGILLLGFDKESWPLTDNELYALLPSELVSTWKAEHSEKSGKTWPDRYPIRARKGYRDRVWFWHRPVQ